MLSKDQLRIAAQRLCEIREIAYPGISDLSAAYLEVLRLQQVYEAISFAKDQTSGTNSNG